jgi:hypothetical protein
LEPCTVSVNEYLKNLSVFPNPASQKVTIQVDNFQKVEVYNFFGQWVASQNSNIVDVSNYSTGIYFFKVFDFENNFANIKVTVTK